jgi:hypothetical protein
MKKIDSIMPLSLSDYQNNEVEVIADFYDSDDPDLIINLERKTCTEQTSKFGHSHDNFYQKIIF